MAGYKQWADGDALTPSELDGYLMGQTLMRFASAAARTAAITTPVAGMRSYLVDTALEYLYSGTQWVPVFQFEKKAAAESAPTSSTTMQDDNHFVWTMVPGTYRVEAFLHFTASTTGDFKCQWSFSGTLTGQGRTCIGPGIVTTDTQGGATNAMRCMADVITAAISYGSDGTNTSAAMEDLWLEISSGGILKLQWAQNTSSGTATTVTIGSRVYITRLK